MLISHLGLIGTPGGKMLINHLGLIGISGNIFPPKNVDHHLALIGSVWRENADHHLEFIVGVGGLIWMLVLCVMHP